MVRKFHNMGGHAVPLSWRMITNRHINRVWSAFDEHRFRIGFDIKFKGMPRRA